MYADCQNDAFHRDSFELESSWSDTLSPLNEQTSTMTGEFAFLSEELDASFAMPNAETTAFPFSCTMTATPAPSVNQPFTTSDKRQSELAANSNTKLGGPDGDPSADSEISDEELDSILARQIPFDQHLDLVMTLSTLIDTAFPASEQRQDTHYNRERPASQSRAATPISASFPDLGKQADFLLLLSNFAQILHNFEICFRFLRLFVKRRRASNQTVDDILACLDRILPSVHMGMVSLSTTTKLRTMIILDFVKTLLAELCNKMQLCVSRFSALQAALYVCNTVVNYAIFCYKFRKAQALYGCQPLRRAPTKDPILGLDHFVRLAKAAGSRRYLETLQQWFREVGSTFGANWMGDFVIFTNEPQNVQALLVTKFADFELGQRRRDNSRQLLGVGIFNADGADWEHSRALVRPNFTRKQVADLAMLEKHVKILLAGLPGKGERVEMQEWFFRFTLDAGTDMLFDQSSNVLLPNAIETARRFAWAFDKGIDGISQKLQMGAFAWLVYDSKYSEACKYVQDYADRIVEAAIERRRTRNSHSEDKQEVEKETEERYTFLNALIDEGTSPREIRNHLLNTLLAARDTTACLMSGAMFELARNPSCQDKLRAEIGRLNGGLPVLEDIKDMRYLNMFLKEVLRLYPPIPLNSRFAKNDSVLPRGGGKDGMGPIFIPKGQLVVYQVYSMHRREDIWGPDAHLFRPERWEIMRPRFEYLPFNAGPRICIGQQFALTETSYVLIRLLQSFSEIKAANPGEVWTENLTITCS
ncbi:hypothetical protein DV738_g3095, partial [Chaetothyriales sp. CBS 135597]